MELLTAKIVLEATDNEQGEFLKRPFTLQTMATCMYVLATKNRLLVIEESKWKKKRPAVASAVARAGKKTVEGMC